ncbi:MAG: hypothetical protein HY243_02490 [Proteobacteria bacterium]|nr:hypothetical protein [Pseudomonadota bacterium]
MKPLYLLLGLCVAFPVFARSAKACDLHPVGFLLGHWKISDGRVFIWGARPNGTLDVTAEEDGSYLVKDKHVLVGVEGQDMGSRDATTVIRCDGDVIRAESKMGASVIQYTIEPRADGRSATLTSFGTQGVAYRITYEMHDQDTLAFTLESKQLSAKDFVSFEVQTLTRDK